MRRSIPPFLFAIAVFPTLFLYARNVEIVPFREFLAPALGVPLLALALSGALRLILRTPGQPPMVAAAWILLSQSYQPIARYVPNPLLVWSLTMLLATFLILRTKVVSVDFVRVLNFVSVVLLIPSLATILLFWVRHQGLAWKATPGAGYHGFRPAAASSANLPNIYHIVLDGYAREDVLLSLYSFDNRPFLEDLRSLGFMVFSRSRSNYWQTLLSLSSTLNMAYVSYVDGLPDYAEAGPTRRGRLEDLVKQSVVREILQEHGYRTISFPTGYSGTELKDADVYLEGYRRGFSRLSSFHYGLLTTTPIPEVLDLFGVSSADMVESHRKTLLNPFQQMGDLSDREAPLWVFAHILAPHPPFVFLEDGSRPACERTFSLADGSDYFKLGGTPEEYRRGYREQLAFINRMVKPAVTRILQRASRPTIIILQSDHGPGLGLNWDRRESTRFDERLPILLALRFPEGPVRELPQDLSPVNVYRIILRRYLALDLPPLENRSYYSVGPYPHRLVPVPPSP